MSYIAIDGPAGSGKSSVAGELAKQIGFYHLNTGSMYRAAAFVWLKAGEPSFSDEFFKYIDERKFVLKDDLIMMDGIRLGDEIRTLEVGKVVSKIAEIPEIRDIVTKKSRDIVKGKNVVVEGRDIGTVVLPDAFLKIFLTASVEERAKRRYNELLSKRMKTNFKDIIDEIRERDLIDSTRKVAPLKPAQDAVIICTDGLSLSDVVKKVYQMYIGRIKIAENKRSE